MREFDTLLPSQYVTNLLTFQTIQWQKFEYNWSGIQLVRNLFDYIFAPAQSPEPGQTRDVTRKFVQRPVVLQWIQIAYTRAERNPETDEIVNLPMLFALEQTQTVIQSLYDPNFDA